MRAQQLETDENVLFYNGLPSHAVFVRLVSFLSCVLPVSELLEPAGMLLLMLMKLRLNVPQKDLAYRFGVSLTFVSSTIDAALLKIVEKLFCLFVLGFYGPVNNEVMSSRSVNSGTVPGQA